MSHRKGDVQILSLVLHDTEEVKAIHVFKNEFNVGKFITPKVESPWLSLLTHWSN